MLVRALLSLIIVLWSSSLSRHRPQGPYPTYAMITPTFLFSALLIAALALTSVYLRGTYQRPTA